jgi:uncharacterized protein (TIGR03435 family)
MRIWRTLVVVMAMVGAEVHAQKSAATPGFEVVTVRPAAPGQAGRSLGWDHRRFGAHNTTISQMMQFAYDVQAKQIIGQPSWFDSDTFDIEGQAETGEPTAAEWRLMMQRLLTERLKMSFHREPKVMPAYVLTVAKGGPKFTAASTEDMDGFKDVVRIQRGQHMWLKVLGVQGSMRQLAAELQRVEMDRPVVDQTGLTGKYDFTLTATSLKPFFAGEEPPTGEDAPPELFTAIREQLGLRLEPTKTAVDCLVLDKVERPVVD